MRLSSRDLWEASAITFFILANLSLASTGPLEGMEGCFLVGSEGVEYLSRLALNEFSEDGLGLLELILMSGSNLPESFLDTTDDAVNDLLAAVDAVAEICMAKW